MVELLAVALSSAINPVLTTGPDALEFNPAQLAYPERPGFTCRILDLAAGLENSSFSAAAYNRYTGAFLDDSAKAGILASIPAGGFRAGGHFAGNTAGFGYRCLAASVRVTADGGLVLPKDLFELALFGNELGREYRAEPLAGTTQLLLRTGIGGATALGSRVFLGGAAHYLRGLFCAQLVEASARFVTTPQAFTGEGRGLYRTATGGSGWAFDAGVAFQLGEWRASLAVLDFSPGINWTEGIEARQYAFRLESTNVFDLLRGQGWSDDFRQTPSAGFTTTLPMQMNTGLARNFGEKFSGCVTVRSYLRSGSGPWLRLRPAVAVEAWPRRWLAAGAGLWFEPGHGVGVELSGAAVWKHFSLTAGLANAGGLLMSARGVELRLGVGYGTAEAGRSRERPDVLNLRFGANQAKD